jgi:hypothetical protein
MVTDIHTIATDIEICNEQLMGLRIAENDRRASSLRLIETGCVEHVQSKCILIS